MPDGQVLEFSGVTKRFGPVMAVDGFSARVEPGVVTGFLGPNGAGKTTSLRILLGLVRPTHGTAVIGGRTYAQLDAPLRSVGAVLEASSFHPGRTAVNHLRVYARAAGISNARVDETLGLVGLADAAGRKVGGFSLGMRQRLGLAYALLGDPGVLVLDEPSNGLDPEGIKWMRGFLRQLAREGRTVLMSSHLLAEVQQTVDSLLVISQGRLVFQGSIDELADPAEYATVVDSPDRAALTAALAAADVPYELLRSGVTVRGLGPTRVGAIAASAGVALSSLARRGPALEEVFLELVRGERVHPSAVGAAAGLPAAGTVAAGLVDLDATADAATGELLVEAAAPAEDAVVAAGAAAAAGAAEQEAAPAPDLDDAAAGSIDGVAAPDENSAAFAGAADTAQQASAAAGAAFAVASTGIIDIVPESDEPPLDADVDVEAIGEIDDELSEATDDVDTSAGSDDHPAFAVASTGIIDIVPGAEAPGMPEPDADVPADAAAEAARPFDDYAKTEADIEADAFFAAFDSGPDAPGSPHEPETEPDEPDPDAAAQGDDAPAETEADDTGSAHEGGEQR